MFRFIKKFDNSNYPTEVINHSTEAVALEDVLAAMTLFLRGCGYHFKGELSIIDPEMDEMLEDMAADYVYENAPLAGMAAESVPPGGK